MTSNARPILRIRSPIIGRSEQVFELGQMPVSIGRAEDCDVVLLEQSASRLHARLVPEDGGWTLVDEESHAGVFVGSQRIRRHRLVDGERFRIGETEMQLVMRPASQPTLVGATVSPTPSTRPPASPAPSAAPAVDIGSAPTIASGAYDGEFSGVPAPSSMSTAPLEVQRPVMPAAPIPRPVPEPIPPPISAPPIFAPPISAPVSAPPIVAPPIAAPQIMAPPIAIERPQAPPQPVRAAPRAPGPGSTPSFVDFGSVGRPDMSGGESFVGGLADDPSRIGEAQDRVTSRWGTWMIVVLLFVGLSLFVLSMAYDITMSDVLSAFD